MDTVFRARRIRQRRVIRDMVREHHVSADDLIYPLFIVEGSGRKEPIEGMPGIFRFSLDQLDAELNEFTRLGGKAVLLFPVPEEKDACAGGAVREDGLLPRAAAYVRKHWPELLIAADICLCAFTDHGHCGLIKGETILNDESIELLAKSSVLCAKAGVDIVAPSAMMDFQVAVIRRGLDEAGLTDTLILAYSAKFASAFYGPFREAAHSAPAFGDRKSYQMDPANRREALKEIELDLGEGADMVMVKPGMPYLDIVREAADITDVPLAVYQVSGEYAMIKAAAMQGWINEAQVVDESLLAFKRAGADLIITYFALDFLRRRSH